ncbi:hypothetical protein IPZ58_24985 [Streptomyces roseoverticillatus]|uniref:hypothetical protein n=1 Tax=Streptomyces roseoverticillatus TaxID=66429 RepID=UPI001F2E5035|nr:hypothetical protein [Streptomyces roseoverticillatus]MCF3104824.1 hypothetical protein [Streptomyces roseoverticillatus]
MTNLVNRQNSATDGPNFNCLRPTRRNLADLCGYPATGGPGMIISPESRTGYPVITAKKEFRDVRHALQRFQRQDIRTFQGNYTFCSK